MKKQLQVSLKTLFVSLFVYILFVNISHAQTYPTAQTLPYTQNFGSSTFTAMPEGTASWLVTSSPIGSQSNAQNSVPNADATVEARTVGTSTGGSYGFYNNNNAQLYIQTSSNGTNGTNQLVLAINTVNLGTISVSYDLSMVTAMPRTIGVVLQYKVGTGSWQNVTGGVYAHNNTDRSTGQVDNITNLTLGTDANNVTVVYLRWAVWRGAEAGSSSGIGIDNISVSGTLLQGQGSGNGWTVNGANVYSNVAGNVGINTNNPTQTLDVNGRINVSGGVIQKGGTHITDTETSDLGLYSGDNNSYMRFVTNNQPILFYSDFVTNKIGSTPNMTIAAGGNVGIGTPYPGKKLHVKTTEAPTNGGGPYMGSIRIEHEVTNFATSTWDLEPIVNPDATKRFSIGIPNNTSMFSINESNGNIGFGTSNPTEKIEVVGFGLFKNSNGFVKIGFNSSHGIIDSDKDLFLNFGTGKDVYIGGEAQYGFATGDLYARHNTYLATSSGNVAIGATTANAKLDVVGDIKTSVGIKFPDGITQTTAAKNYLQGTGISITGTYPDFTIKSTLSDVWSPAINGTDIFTNTKVGIGTNNPNSLLHIKNNRPAGSFAIFEPDLLIEGPNTAYISFNTTNNQNWGTVGFPYDNDNFYLMDIYGDVVFYNGGNVGIHSLSPTDVLEVGGGGNICLSAKPLPGGSNDVNDAGDIIFKKYSSDPNTNNQLGRIWTNYYNGQSGLYLSSGDNTADITINENGSVGIGTGDLAIDEGIKLAVSGLMTTTGLKIKANVLVPDYVFSPDYKITSLKDIEKFVLQNHHLPDVPSAKEFEKDGIDVANTNMLLLKKVEELTLHLIEQSKQIEQLMMENKKVNEVLSTLKTK